MNGEPGSNYKMKKRLSNIMELDFQPMAELHQQLYITMQRRWLATFIFIWRPRVYQVWILAQSKSYYIGD